MFPPGTGNDPVQSGKVFIISIYGTGKVFTANGDQLVLKEYENEANQVWLCYQRTNDQYCFMNQATGKLLSSNILAFVTCDRTTVLSPLEEFTVTQLDQGGYQFSYIDGKTERVCILQPGIQVMHECMMVDKDELWKWGLVQKVLGLHDYVPGVFRNFSWPFPGHLARSSAPHYDTDDEDERMDLEAVEFLELKGITKVVSVNSCALLPEEKDLLKSRGIGYAHVPVPKHGVPTLQQLCELSKYERHSEHGVTTLVCGGFGGARTGIVISMLQMKHEMVLSERDYRVNGVNTPAQILMLNDLKAQFGV